ITMLTLPFMSCSARLPVYTIFAMAFFPESPALVMFGLYVFGILMALGAAWCISRVYRTSEESHFVMEIPPYRMPVAKSVLRHTWEKGRQYLQKMAGLILVASMAVWLLGYFPRGGEHLTDAQQQEQSYLGRAGHALQPLIEPLGFDWRMGVGILAGGMAKELMVSTLGVLYDIPADRAASAGFGDDHSTDLALSSAIREHVSPAAGLAYMVFALLYFPCAATLAAIRGETGRWRYAIWAGVYTTAIAYLMAWAAYTLLRL
ncbi:MAG: ferrous iron transporter B, partial [Bacteroidaceae bacterium]|nr:ferrous iron transporter B [Bacteroidaceae bacterium]